MKVIVINIGIINDYAAAGSVGDGAGVSLSLYIVVVQFQFKKFDVRQPPPPLSKKKK
jgi:hypothetical protein